MIEYPPSHPPASETDRGPTGFWRRLRSTLSRLLRPAQHRALSLQRMAVERSAWPVSVIKPDGRLLWVNPAFAGLCGRPRLDCVHREIAELLGLATHDPAGLKHLVDCLAERRPERISLRGQRPDGRPLHLLVEVRQGLVRDALVLQWLDQSEQVATSQQLQTAMIDLTRERERLGHILAGTQVGAWEVNLITGEARMDEAWAALFGYARAELMPWTRDKARALMHPDDQGPTTLQINEHVAGRRSGIDLEQRVRHKDGHWVWVHSRGKIATRTADGKPEWLSGSHMDISARKQQEQALAEQQAYTRTLLASLPGVVFEFTLDEQGQIRMIFLSEALRAMFGLDPAQALSQPELLFTAVPEEDMTALRQAILASSRSMKQLEQEYRIVGRAGVRWLGVHARPERRPDGRVHWLGMLLDVTRRHELAEELAQARNAAEDANRAKSAFLATMSHEIRSPMNGVLGMTDVLLSAASPEDQADAVQTIRDSAVALLTLIDDILDFSKIEAGRLALERVSFNPGQLTETVCESLASSAAARQVAVQVRLTPNLPCSYWGDPTRFRQILFNLISNAIKFSSPSPGGRGRVEVNVMKADGPQDGLVLRVQDWGIGIAEEALPHLFQPFSQADASTTRRFGGTGLGLAIVQRLVDAMDGHVALDTAVGRGTRIDVTLPLAVCDAQPERPSHHLCGLACLLVSEEASVVTEWRALLGAAGAQVDWRPRLDLAALRQAAPVEPGRPLIVVLAHEEAPPELATLRTLRRESRLDVRFLCLALRGAPQPLQFLEPDVASARLLRRQAFWRAMATLAGEASPELPLMAAGRPVERYRAVPPDRGTARAKGRLVLVVEDQAVNQKVAVRQLGLLGVLADVASDGQQALALWRGEAYALILTDLHMPRMDGYAMVQALRREERDAGRPRTPVLALTANALRGEERRAREAGMDEYLTKPIPLDALHSALQRWMPALSPRNPAQADAAGQPSGRAEVPSQEPALDPDALRRLVGDDPAVLAEFMADFAAALAHLSEELRAAFDTADLSLVGAVAHKLKSAARAVGALPLARLCERLCQVHGHGAGAPQEAALLQRERVDFERLVEALERALPRREASPP